VNALLVVVLGAQLASANSALEKCRALDREFDTKNMPKPCQAAADDTTLSIAERVEALRRLAFAHILNGDESLAEPAFLKMLVFSPTAELPADAGPRFRETFNDVKQRFLAEGRLTTTTPPPGPTPEGPVPVQVDLADKLGRVVGARVISYVSGRPQPLEDRLVRSELSPGLVRFTGTVPEDHEAKPTPEAPVTTSWSVVFEGWDGQPIEATPPVKGEISRGAPAVVAPAAEGDLPWGWIIGGTAGGLAVAGGIVGGTVYCFVAGPCRTQEAWVRVQIRQEAP
jgi:hypothetical protein